MSQSGLSAAVLTPPIILWGEFTAIFLLWPAALAAIQVQRPGMFISLWLTAACCTWIMARSAPAAWQTIWHGQGWTEPAQRKAAFLRFALCAILAAGFIYWFFPQYFFNLPRQRPLLWLAVMVFYPLLSVVPQEIIFRSFFLHRYDRLFPEFWRMTIVNSLCFGFMHIILHNWVAPALSVIGNVIFLYGYRQHQSLKWVIIEHAAYGCMIFTVGLGWFFLHGLS